MSVGSLITRQACGFDPRDPLPIISTRTVRLRELTPADAPSLVEHICDPRVAAHIGAPPPSEAAFCDFIKWTHAQRAAGRHLCFGIVPAEQSLAVGLIQVWPIESDFGTAEWGFAIGRRFWGTGLFPISASLLCSFVFSTLRVGRLEARCSVDNERGNGALRKLGAVAEGVLRGGTAGPDRLMWSILADEWLRRPDAESAGTLVGDGQ